MTRTAREGLALEERRTPGEWTTRYELAGSHGGGNEWHVDAPSKCVSCSLSDGDEQAARDAAFIAFAANHWREMAEAVIAMERVVEAAVQWANTRHHADGHKQANTLWQAAIDYQKPTPKQGADDAG